MTNKALYIEQNGHKLQLTENITVKDAIEWLCYYRQWFPGEEFSLE